MLSIRLVALALVSVGLSSLAQLAFKYGMMRPEVQSAVASDSWVSRLIGSLSNPGVLGGFSLVGVSGVLRGLRAVALEGGAMAAGPVEAGRFRRLPVRRPRIRDHPAVRCPAVRR